MLLLGLLAFPDVVTWIIWRHWNRVHPLEFKTHLMFRAGCSILGNVVCDFCGGMGVETIACWLLSEMNLVYLLWSVQEFEFCFCFCTMNSHRHIFTNRQTDGHMQRHRHHEQMPTLPLEFSKKDIPLCSCHYVSTTCLNFFTLDSSFLLVDPALDMWIACTHAHTCTDTHTDTHGNAGTYMCTQNWASALSSKRFKEIQIYRFSPLIWTSSVLCQLYLQVFIVFNISQVLGLVGTKLNAQNHLSLVFCCCVLKVSLSPCTTPPL